MCCFIGIMSGDLLIRCYVIYIGILLFLFAICLSFYEFILLVSADTSLRNINFNIAENDVITKVPSFW